MDTSIPEESKLFSWLSSDVEFEVDIELEKENLEKSYKISNTNSELKISKLPEKKYETQNCYQDNRILPPFMYTTFVILLHEMKALEFQIEKLKKIMSKFGYFFHQMTDDKQKIRINNQIILYNQQLTLLCQRLILVKIKIITAQSVIKLIPIEDHKARLINAIKYYCIFPKEQNLYHMFRNTHSSITLEIKYVNHYEFHEMETIRF
jgi:hypothetical protein